MTVFVPAPADVPCNGCTACCKHDLIFLHPEQGDDPATYEGHVMQATNPLTGESGLALTHKPEGGCSYLGDHGCTIHGRAPAICRTFDCRKMFASLFELPRPERRRVMKTLQKQGLLGMEVIEAAQARMHTLDPAAMTRRVAEPG